MVCYTIVVVCKLFMYVLILLLLFTLLLLLLFTLIFLTLLLFTLLLLLLCHSAFKVLHRNKVRQPLLTVFVRQVINITWGQLSVFIQSLWAQKSRKSYWEKIAYIKVHHGALPRRHQLVNLCFLTVWIRFAK